jgi:hypothetical protein
MNTARNKRKNSNKTRRRGGNNMKLVTSFYLFRLPPQGGRIDVEIYTNNNDIKIDCYANKGSPNNHYYQHLTETIKNAGKIPDEFISLYNVAFAKEPGNIQISSIYTLMLSIVEITKILVSYNNKTIKCETDLETCNNKNREISNENQTLINKLAKLPLAFSE